MRNSVKLEAKYTLFVREKCKHILILTYVLIYSFRPKCAHNYIHMDVY